MFRGFRVTTREGLSITPLPILCGADNAKLEYCNRTSLWIVQMKQKAQLIQIMTSKQGCLS